MGTLARGGNAYSDFQHNLARRRKVEAAPLFVTIMRKVDFGIVQRSGPNRIIIEAVVATSS